MNKNRVDANRANDPALDKPARPVPEQQTPLLAACFQTLFGVDADLAASREQAEKRPAPRPGRPQRSGETMAARRLKHPLAQLYVAAALAEVGYLPLCVAHSAEERDRYTQTIPEVIGLTRALAAGVITGWVVCWPAGRYPKCPSSVRLLTAGGRGSRERCLGELGPQLRQWTKLLKAAFGGPP